MRFREKILTAMLDLQTCTVTPKTPLEYIGRKKIWLDGQENIFLAELSRDLDCIAAEIPGSWHMARQIM